MKTTHELVPITNDLAVPPSLLNANGYQAVPLPTPAEPLTPEELANHTTDEAIIEKGFETFWEVGQAFIRIRDGRTYRMQFSTFEDYCRIRWDMTARRALQLCSATEIAERLKSKGHRFIPAAESVLRPLSVLPEDLQDEAWAQAVRTAKNLKPTARHVQSVVNRLRGIEPAAKLSGSDSIAIDAGSKQDRILAATQDAIAKLRYLQDAIGTPDSAATAKLSVALDIVHDIKLQTERVEKLQASRQ